MMENEKTTRRGDVSFFWPVILIGVGVIALLVNAGRLQVENLWGLLNLWPLLLVLAGIDLIFGRRWPALGGLLALGLVGVVVWLLLQGSVPTWVGDRIIIGDLHINTSPADVTQDRYTAPRDGAQNMLVDLELTSFPVEVKALPAGGANLFDATIDHAGPMRFEVSGEAERRLLLGLQGAQLNVGRFPTSNYHWDVRLADDLPLDLGVDVGSGNVSMDLSGVELTKLVIKGGSGDVEALLPPRAYALNYEGGSGDLALDVAAASNADLTLATGSGNTQVMVGADADANTRVRDGGSGDLRLLIPRTMAVQVEVQSAGSGAVQLPRDLVRQRGQDKEGLWQSAGFESASHKITLVAQNLGSGDLVVSYR